MKFLKTRLFIRILKDLYRTPFYQWEKKPTRIGDIYNLSPKNNYMIDLYDLEIFDLKEKHINIGKLYLGIVHCIIFVQTYFNDKSLNAKKNSEKLTNILK